MIRISKQYRSYLLLALIAVLLALQGLLALHHHQDELPGEQHCSLCLFAHHHVSGPISEAPALVAVYTSSQTLPGILQTRVAPRIRFFALARGPPAFSYA